MRDRFVICEDGSARSVSRLSRAEIGDVMRRIDRMTPLDDATHTEFRMRLEIELLIRDRGWQAPA